ncbi:MAG: PAS domain-containing protein [Haloarculaceae archaeon]
MLSPTVLAYIGDPDHSLAVSRVFQGRAETDLHLLTIPPDAVETTVADDRLDGVICGGSLDSEELQAILDAVDAVGADVPVFDLTNAVAAVPSAVDVHHLYPTSDATRAADEILATAEPTASATDETLGRERDEDPAESTASEGPDGGLSGRTERGLEPTITTDREWCVVDWDPRLDDRLAVDEPEAVGRSLGEAFPALADQTVRTIGEGVLESGEPETAEITAGDGEWLEVRAVPADAGLVWFVRDVTERKRYEQELEAARERLENTLERIDDAFFVLDTDEKFVLLNSRAEFVLDLDGDTVVGERFWDVFPAAVSTTFYHEFTEAIETQEPTSFEEYYRPLDSWFEVNAYPSEDGLSVFLRDVTEQVQLQQKLESLHDTTQQLIVAQSDQEIAREAVQAAVEVLDFPLTVCWRFDETRHNLQPLAWSEAVAERVDEVQAIAADSGMAWDAYDESTLRVIDSVTIVTPNSHHPGDVGSALLVPLGEYGLLGTYAIEEEAFDETDIELLRVLATAVESAMARAMRERQLARRNERLNDFASTVSHDLRNPLHIASARTELARDTGDTEHLAKVSEALERMETLIEDLLDRARGEQDLDRETVSLAAAAEDAWAGVDTGGLTLDVQRDATFSADPTRLKQLFENVYRNAVEHAGPDVTVTVGVHDDGFYVGDDGRGIPEDNRDDVFEQGVTDNEAGTGYGLAIVSEIVEGHGWSIEATENDAGGACFEVHHIRSLETAESEAA